MIRYKVTAVLVFAVLTLAVSCQKTKLDGNEIDKVKLDIQGHRGARGLMPENTIPAFLKALELGVTTLEMDLAVTKDKQLLVSHEPYMNPEMCLDSLDNEISIEDKYAHNIYEMTLEQIQSFDCGMKDHPRFPKQQKLNAIKPLLKDVIYSVDEYVSKNARDSVFYNIEIKSKPEGDNVFHPAPKEFSDLAYAFISKNMNPKHVIIQSFDFRVLQYFRKMYPEIKLAVLIEGKNSIEQNLEELGFVPKIYSCDFTLLTEENISMLQSKNIQVIPWTVNNTADMEQLLSWNVDGLITDYPDSLQIVLNKR